MAANPLALLPAPFTTTTTTTTTTTAPPTLITQGAEALLFHTTFLTTTTPCALKLRPRKTYRHPTLDARLTRQRLLAEARVLVRCARLGVAVPAVLGVDWEAGWIACEWVAGRTVRQVLDARIREVVSGAGEDGEDEEEERRRVDGDGELVALMGRVGRVVGRLHEVAVVHGDLTTSNLMVRERQGDDGTVGDDAPHISVGEVVIIDFGLGVQSAQDEDRAVDLYVLERAFISTHPMAEGLFKEVLKAYAQAFKGGKVVLKKLEEVRQRGRKKSMLG